MRTVISPSWKHKISPYCMLEDMELLIIFIYVLGTKMERCFWSFLTDPFFPKSGIKFHL